MSELTFIEDKLDTQPGVWFPENTPEKVRKMYNLYCGGFSLRRIAPLYDMSHQGVADSFKRYHLPTRLRGYPVEANQWKWAE